MDEERRLSYFFLGLGIGVAVGILFAPKSGEETREIIRSKAEEGTEYLRRRGSELRESASELIERGKSAVARQKEQIAAAVDAGRQAYRESVASAAGETSGS
ncbi:MAG: YtxH domain-containing protein [Bryobacteraceae bacterium]|nr:YtxH domain-containing protein [Bryobacteraceae bacterium]MDW8377388.1 YtxH domain-containing protein [Bryobacterales bacterium]